MRDAIAQCRGAGIREGRVIFRNIQKFAIYLLPCNLGEVLIVGLAMLPGLPLRILFLNLVTGVFPAFSLGAGEAQGGILRHRPRDPSRPMITRALWAVVVLHSLAISGAKLAALIVAREGLGRDGQAAFTVSFVTLALACLQHARSALAPAAE